MLILMAGLYAYANDKLVCLRQWQICMLAPMTGLYVYTNGKLICLCQ
mgnify:CR=1 FL=1